MGSFFRDFFSQALSYYILSLHGKSYTFRLNEAISEYEVRLKKYSQYDHCVEYAHKYKATYVPSTSGNDVACVMIEPNEKPRYIILFNHGGTVDLGDLLNFLWTFGTKLQCNVMVYDYSGFGETRGKTTEKAIYADGQAVLDYLMDKYKTPLSKIIFYGQSLGTAVALHLACHNRGHAGIVLHSPFLSTGKLYFTKPQGSCKNYDLYKNVEMIKQVDSPCLIMHGTADMTVPLKHGKELYKLSRNPVPPLWIEGGGHDDLYSFDEYMKRLKRFITIDLEEIF